MLGNSLASPRTSASLFHQLTEARAETTHGACSTYRMV